MNGWWFRSFVKRHLGLPLSEATVIEESFLDVDLPNLHVAMEHWEEPGKAEVLKRYGVPRHAFLFDTLREGKLASRAIRYDMVQIGPRKRVRVPQAILYFIRFEGQNAVLWNEQDGLFIAGADADLLERAIERLKKLMREHNCYRGQVLRLGRNPPCYAAATLWLPAVGRCHLA